MSVNVQTDPPSSMSASFSLRGNALNGELDLYSPLGTTLGALQWSPQSAKLSQGTNSESFSSLTALTEKLTGAALPIDALFDWLMGESNSANGWDADLSNLKQGVLFAKRIKPAPEITLRIKLD